MNLFERQKQIVEGNIRRNYEQTELIKALEPDLAKGKKANIGEIREWQGHEYKKTVQGWEKIKKENVRRWKEDLVDEDTGEEYSIERTEDLDPKRKDSPSQKRRERKEDLKERKDLSKYVDKKHSYQDKKEELKGLLRERKQLESEMEQEAGNSDEKGNEYGEKLNKLDVLIERRKRALVNLSKSEEALEILGL